MQSPYDESHARLAVWAAALGYFVDIFDLVLFSVVRVPSLRALGLPEPRIFPEGIFLLNLQLGGMLLGGFFWGMLGDRRGRLQVLFGSILTYSLANLANAFVTTLPAYACCRLVAGFGLAGELGAGITLVSELLPVRGRGYGTMIVASVGLSGAVAAALVGEHLDFRTAYAIGGILGFALLAFRLGVRESRMFEHVAKRTDVRRGNFCQLFTNKSRAGRYFGVVALGLPNWFCLSILVTFSPEIGKALGLVVAPSAARAILWNHSGSAIGGFASGLLSERIGSRKKVILLFFSAALVNIGLYFTFGGTSDTALYFVCLLLGISTGYWAVFITLAAEQFGTNLRATATTTAPNVVRGSMMLVTFAFRSLQTRVGTTQGALMIGGVIFLLAFVALTLLPETHGRSLDFVEEDAPSRGG